jgi:hypothetical protein
VCFGLAAGGFDLTQPNIPLPRQSESYEKPDGPISEMKKFIALSVVMFASYGAFAEEQIDKVLVAPAPPTPASYFRSNEFSGGIFGGYLDGFGGNNQGMGNRAFGGGLEASYFYFKYLGLSVDGNAFNESPGGPTWVSFTLRRSSKPVPER